ncbi:hypothetical protein QBC47DRAFT_120292 [Echria macrotheca]|uniref:Uncharacterized protein n=1 Tax=Echria macrotheca TaxID=438768 RepID=A0AAJ0B582_9PEZI|nr:hypothetical protein QBC47DRAFT_120292 [Echria macrotheca]
MHLNEGFILLFPRSCWTALCLSVGPWGSLEHFLAFTPCCFLDLHPSCSCRHLRSVFYGVCVCRESWFCLLAEIFDNCFYSLIPIRMRRDGMIGMIRVTGEFKVRSRRGGGGGGGGGGKQEAESCRTGRLRSFLGALVPWGLFFFLSFLFCCPFFPRIT